jgi:hypothetical protein
MKSFATSIVLFAAIGLLQLRSTAADLPPPEGATVSTDLTPDHGRIIVEARGLPAPAPVFYAVTASQVLQLGAAGIRGEMQVRVRVLQGKPQVLTLGLSGEGDVTEVTGATLQSWSVRRPVGAEETRFLDLQLGAGVSAPADLDFVVHSRRANPPIPGVASLLLATPGGAAGFSSTLELRPDPDVDLKVSALQGLVTTGLPGGAAEVTHYLSTGDAALAVRLSRRGAALADEGLSGVQLSGRLSPKSGAVEFHLQGLLQTRVAGARLRLLSGRVALSGSAVGDGWHVELVPVGHGAFAFDLVGERVGDAAVNLPFVAAVREEGDWRRLEFSMPAGGVVPLRLEGLAAGSTFDPRASIVPAAVPGAWQGFLPADGAASLAWRASAAPEQGSLEFTSVEQTDVRVGAGLARESARLSLRVLQGKLAAVRCQILGGGEVVGVEGANVVGWKVLPEGTGRVLAIDFSRPLEAEGILTVTSQVELGGFPVNAALLRLVPEGVVRHSGFLRVESSGSVRLEVTNVAGMMQLAPAQFPGPAAEDARQVFVYRFPSADYGYRVAATEIEPEVGVSEVATYELSETDRLIDASVELDVREAPLRSWTVNVPEDYAVASVEGVGVADYVAEAAARDGYRPLKVVFGGPVEGRQLLHLRLEKNEPAAAGDWALRPLRFPGAKSVRGNIGVVSSPGYRLVPAGVSQLTEVPLTYFPRQTPGLQQAWRLRDPDWSAGVRVEALGQSVQADVFHLYSIKEGIIYASVVLNYFVIGAPATEWRIEVPPAVGNIEVVGQGAQRDWRREGNQVIVALHQPVLGSSTLLVTFEQPMSARGGTIEAGQVRPLGVQSERGYIEVVSPLQVKLEVTKAEGGLLKLDPQELPTELRLLSGSPALAAYQYTGRPFAFTADVEWYAAAPTADQVVDFARLSSRVSRDGQVVTDVQYYVKTHGRKALRLTLPPGVRLWEVLVDKVAAAAQVDGGDTLIPLPPRANPNEPVLVALRLGQAAGPSVSTVEVRAPRLVAPVMVTQWTLEPDGGRALVPRGGTGALVRPASTETGLEWISARGFFPLILVLGLVALAALLLQAPSRGRVLAGLGCCLVAMSVSSLLAADALLHRRVNRHELVYASTLVSPAEDFSIRVENVAAWRAPIVGWGVAAAVAGVGIALALRLPRFRRAPDPRAAAPVAAVLVSLGLLAQHGGAAAFFAAASAGIFFLLFMPGTARWEAARSPAGDPPPEPGAGAAAALPLLLLLAAVGLGIPNSLRAERIEPAPPGSGAMQSDVEIWDVRDGRLFATVAVTVRGVPGENFLLLRAPATLTAFSGDGLRVAKSGAGPAASYFVAPERAGLVTAQVRFEMPVENVAKGIVIPTGTAVTKRITVDLDQGGWDLSSPAAVEIEPAPGLPEGHSGAVLVLAPQASSTLVLHPRGRDLASEATRFYAEGATLYVPGPGVVDGVTQVTVRPVQGRVTELTLEVPRGFTVGDVLRGPVGAWRFDPRTQLLHLAIEPAQTGSFHFQVLAQLGAGGLPFPASLAPLRVRGAAGEVGTLAVAFGSDAQPEAVTTTGLTAINVQDFDGRLLRRAEGEPAATIQQAWSYGAAGAHADLVVAAVDPEVRATCREVLSIDDDRLVLAADLGVSIARAGLFKLSFALPEGLELESLSGDAVSQWTEATEAGRRIVTIHLKGRTLGDQGFALALSGAAPGPQGAWSVPGLSVREAGRQTGEALLVPGKGIRLRVVDRLRATQIDPGAAGNLQPGTLAFHLLQGDWSLRVGIEALEPWVTVQSLEEVTVREGQTLTRIGLHYRIDNAAVKAVRIRLPNLDEAAARTVRADGAAVSDILRVPGSPDVWEVRFQRGLAGETDLQVEFQSPADGGSRPLALEPPDYPGVRQATQFVAVRGGGRIELEVPAPARGWRAADWESVPPALQARTDRTVPALCFRVSESDGPLTVAVRRHDIADELALRVTRADLTTVFSLAGSALTSAEFRIVVLETSTLRARLTEGSRLFGAFVNGESVRVVRDGDAYLFPVGGSLEGDHAATVRLVYATPGSGAGPIRLVAPRLSVPLENVAWNVVVPPGLRLERYRGGLVLRGERLAGLPGVEQYRSQVELRKVADAQKAVGMLEEANSYLQGGDQQRASEMLSRASTAELDEASNEDARVQLRVLKTQQTLLGLNTRRQRVYLENRADGARNDELEQAARVNPFMAGKVNFDPQAMEQLLGGNTAEDNSALRGIAARLVDQQLAPDPAPTAIDATLPELGEVLTFTRSLQVDGNVPLELNLTVGRAPTFNRWFSALALLGIGALVALAAARRPAAPGFASVNPQSP